MKIGAHVDQTERTTKRLHEVLVMTQVCDGAKTSHLARVAGARMPQKALRASDGCIPVESKVFRKSRIGGERTG